MIIVKNNRKYRGNTMEQTYIDIMIQSLEKKEQVLDRIIELDIKQKNQLEDPQLTPDDFDEVVEAKRTTRSRYAPCRSISAVSRTRA